jgi:hypothetical protein
VRIGVRQVVTDGHLNVFNTFYDTWAKVLVTLDNDKVDLVLKSIEGMTLVPQEVTWTLLGFGSTLNSVAKGL